jgi:hypothetical protein
LEENLLSYNFPVYLYKSTHKQKFDDPNVEDTPQFIHQFVKNGGVVNSPYWPLVEIVANQFFMLYGKKKVWRCKLNLNYQHPSGGDDKYYIPHLDQSQDFQHTTMIYYVNDSDGDTILFDDYGTILQRIQPKKGRLVFWNDNIMHAGQIPQKNELRCVINFNFVELDKV